MADKFVKDFRYTDYDLSDSIVFIVCISFDSSLHNWSNFIKFQQMSGIWWIIYHNNLFMYDINNHVTCFVL